MKKKPAPKKEPERQSEPSAFKLAPLTKQREVTAADMGMRFGFVADYKAQYFLRDTIIVLWLCSIPVEGKGWTVDRAEESPKLAVKEAMQWAERMGIAIDTARFNEGYTLFIAMMRKVQASKGEPVIPAKAAREEPDESEC